ncbi:MAG: DUF1987 domain-containing protein [Bacteroidales bacterium]|jgi:hypothetical protein|nr:DUF1987 domain-containing protein [Bacteroidales bacterium]MDD4672755.1 DUF1987 domain-containing protein [Bacteroidales bacterium]MDY0347773.1 DUF1987 domain-containing protein [Tenuifilaceae bacterium]
MNNLYIKGNSKTPEIDFSKGTLKISGRSIPEDAVTFYRPIIKWIENYIAQPEKLTEVSISIEYINSGSNRFLYNILTLLEKCYFDGNKVNITWYYEEDDDTIKYLGLDFKGLFKVPISLVIIT